jgi:dTMP kinase
MTNEIDTTQAKPIPGGLLVAFEGVDGAGKSTQARSAVVQLKTLGYEAVYLKEPTDGPIGTRLRQMMVSGTVRDHTEEFRLFLEDRSEDVRQNILPVLDAGGIVCMDRYYISSMAYQGALGLDPEFIKSENEKIAPPPDLILYFHIPLEESLKRIVKSRPGGQNLFEVREYQEKVQRIFEAMTFPQMTQVDAMLPFAEVTDQIMGRIAEAITKKIQRATMSP